jgi:hypothetical protein
MSDLRKILQPDGGRVETGAIQFGDDWPGLFIRGDNALYYGAILRLSLGSGVITPLDRHILTGLAEELQSVDIRKDGLMAEPADAVALKATDESHGGSTPSGPTKTDWFDARCCPTNPPDVDLAKIDFTSHKVLPDGMIGDVEITPMPKPAYVRWAEDQPESERNVEIGQKRFFAIDGFGMMEGTVVRLTNESCWIKEDGAIDDFAWEVPWDGLSAMTGVGIIINGIEHQKVMEDAEREALNAGSVQP